MAHVWPPLKRALILTLERNKIEKVTLLARELPVTARYGDDTTTMREERVVASESPIFRVEWILLACGTRCIVVQSIHKVWLLMENYA